MKGAPVQPHTDPPRGEVVAMKPDRNRARRNDHGPIDFRKLTLTPGK